MKPLATILLLFALAAFAWAQAKTTTTTTPILPPAARAAIRLSRDLNSGVGGYGYGGGNFSSTLQEGVMQGYGAMAYAQGKYNLDTSEAWRNLMDAQAQGIANAYAAKQYIQQDVVDRYTRFGNYAALNAMRRGTKEQMNRLAREAAPPRLSPYDLDPSTGRISWPTMLLTAAFAPFRQDVDQLFAQRAHLAGLPAEAYLRLDKSITDMSGILRDHIYEMPPDLYLGSRRFLNSLAYEATLSPNAAPGAQIGMNVPGPAAQQAAAPTAVLHTAAKPVLEAAPALDDQQAPPPEVAKPVPRDRQTARAW